MSSIEFEAGLVSLCVGFAIRGQSCFSIALHLE